MPEMSVHSSETIDASASTVMAALEDFRTWPVWSPWLYTEPDATVTYEGEAGKPGHGYQWQGNKVGAGSMSLQSRDERNLHLDLEFLKPFKSQADVSFALDSPTPESTTVTWTMDSKLPFFMFFYKATMVGMIRSDYRRGLMMLKDYLEHGEVLSNVKIEAIADCPASHYIGLASEASMAQLASTMDESFATLLRAASDASIEISGPPMCFYNRMNIKEGRSSFTVALPTDNKQSISSPMLSTERPACKALKLVHQGAYRHLGNAWATIMGEARARKLKVSRNISPFEIYINDPKTTDEKDLITEVYLPLR